MYVQHHKLIAIQLNQTVYTILRVKQTMSGTLYKTLLSITTTLSASLQVHNITYHRHDNMNHTNNITNHLQKLLTLRTPQTKYTP